MIIFKKLTLVGISSIKIDNYLTDEINKKVRIIF